MNCPKHPNEKMVQLFSSWACDACDGKKTEPSLLSRIKESFLNKIEFPFGPAFLVPPNTIYIRSFWTLSLLVSEPPLPSLDRKASLSIFRARPAVSGSVLRVDIDHDCVFFTSDKYINDIIDIVKVHGEIRPLPITSYWTSRLYDFKITFDEEAAKTHNLTEFK